MLQPFPRAHKERRRLYGGDAEQAEVISVNMTDFFFFFPSYIFLGESGSAQDVRLRPHSGP